MHNTDSIYLVVYFNLSNTRRRVKNPSKLSFFLVSSALPTSNFSNKQPAATSNEAGHSFSLLARHRRSESILKHEKNIKLSGDRSCAIRENLSIQSSAEAAKSRRASAFSLRQARVHLMRRSRPKLINAPAAFSPIAHKESPARDAKRLLTGQRSNFTASHLRKSAGWS